MDSLADFRAAARFAAVSSEFATRVGSVSGLSNIPARYFKVSTRRTAVSSCVSVILPDASSCGP